VLGAVLILTGNLVNLRASAPIPARAATWAGEWRPAAPLQEISWAILAACLWSKSRRRT